MIANDYKIYKEHLMNSLLTVRQTEIMTDILDKCFSKDIQPAVANTLVTNYYNNVMNIVLPMVERLQKPSIGSPCDLCKLVSSKDVYLRSTYTGDLGNISPLSLFDNAIKDLFEHRINNLHFGSLNTISATSKNVTGISSLENIILLTKPIGFRRASGVAHIVALTINEQIYETNPLMRIEFNDLGTLEEFKEGWDEDIETLLPEILDAYTDTICEYDNVANLDIIIDDNNYFYGDMLTLIKVDVLNSIAPAGWTFLDS